MNPPEMFGSDLADDIIITAPLDLLDLWLARVGGGGDLTTTPLMALSTVDADGYPRVRHVLLSDYDHGRLHFHTDTRTAKAAELAANPRAAATLVWPDIPRQLCVSGDVVAETPEEAAAAFAQRSRYLQLLAWVNDTRLAQIPAVDRAEVWDAFDREHPTLEPPPTWAGFVLEPRVISFWRGVQTGPAQRISCRRGSAGWSVERLPG